MWDKNKPKRRQELSPEQRFERAEKRCFRVFSDYLCRLREWKGQYEPHEPTATLYTRDKAVMRKLDTLVADFPDTYKLIGQDKVSKTYSFPKSYVCYHKPGTVSAEQREWARKMMIERNIL